MKNFLEQDGFIKFLNDRIIEEKIIRLQAGSDITYILQIINMLYGTRIYFINKEIKIDEGSFFFLEIHLIE